MHENKQVEPVMCTRVSALMLVSCNTCWDMSKFGRKKGGSISKIVSCKVLVTKKERKEDESPRSCHVFAINGYLSQHDFQHHSKVAYAVVTCSKKTVSLSHNVHNMHQKMFRQVIGKLHLPPAARRKQCFEQVRDGKKPLRKRIQVQDAAHGHFNSVRRECRTAQSRRAHDWRNRPTNRHPPNVKG